MSTLSRRTQAMVLWPGRHRHMCYMGRFCSRFRVGLCKLNEKTIIIFHGAQEIASRYKETVNSMLQKSSTKVRLKKENRPAIVKTLNKS